MKYTKLIIAALGLSVLAGCANRPESISASFVSHERYTGHECTLLTQEKIQAIESLMLASDLQDDAADGDAIGVFLIGVPFSQLTGDHEADVAKWKGTVDAIETTQIMQKCAYTAYVTAPKKTIVTEIDDGSDLSFAQ